MCPALTVDDVMLAERMAFGIVMTSVDPSTVRDHVAAGLALCRRLPNLD